MIRPPAAMPYPSSFAGIGESGVPPICWMMARKAYEDAARANPNDPNLADLAAKYNAALQTNNAAAGQQAQAKQNLDKAQEELQTKQNQAKNAGAAATSAEGTATQADKNATWTILALAMRTSEYIADQRKGGTL